MTAEQFECLIPTHDAFKEGVLYCSTNATNAIDIWVAFGTVGSAVAAVGLAIWSVVDSRKSHRRADEAVQREIASSRREKLLEYARPILDALEGMESLDKEKLIVQSGKLTRLSSTYEINVGPFGPEERKFGEALRSLCNSVNYAVSVRLYEPFFRGNKPAEMGRLGFKLALGMVTFDNLVRGALVELAHAESERDAQGTVEQFRIDADAWIEKFGSDPADDE